MVVLLLVLVVAVMVPLLVISLLPLLLVLLILLFSLSINLSSKFYLKISFFVFASYEFIYWDESFLVIIAITETEFTLVLKRIGVIKSIT